MRHIIPAPMTCIISCNSESYAAKTRPILNPTRRSSRLSIRPGIAFAQARVIADLYSEADHFVDRVFHALEDEGVPAERVWEAARMSDDGGAQIRVLCEEGTVIASTAPRGEHVIPAGGRQITAGGAAQCRDAFWRQSDSTVGR